MFFVLMYKLLEFEAIHKVNYGRQRPPAFLNVLVLLRMFVRMGNS